MKHLMAIQRELKAPKGNYNSFGKYKYRSCEDILEAVKPLCYKNESVLTISDELCQIGERYYVKATATLKTPDTEFIATAYARESETKKGQDESQITGTASSYARKYALNGLFCIDDTKDADTNEYHSQSYARKYGLNGLFCIDDTKDADTDEYHNQSEKALVREIKELLAVKEMTIEDFEKTAKDKLENLSVERLEKGLEWLKKQ